MGLMDGLKSVIRDAVWGGMTMTSASSTSISAGHTARATKRSNSK